MKPLIEGWGSTSGRLGGRARQWSVIAHEHNVYDRSNKTLSEVLQLSIDVSNMLNDLTANNDLELFLN